MKKGDMILEMGRCLKNVLMKKCVMKRVNMKKGDMILEMGRCLKNVLIDSGCNAI